jgi:hypothetical protein
LFGVGAWAVAFAMLYLLTPSDERSVHLLTQMLAWSLVGLAFGITWYTAHRWVDGELSFDADPRRFKWVQAGVWIGTALVMTFVFFAIGNFTSLADSTAKDMCWLTFLATPVMLGVRNPKVPFLPQRPVGSSAGQ